MRAAYRLSNLDLPGLSRVAVLVSGLATIQIAFAQSDSGASANFAPNDPPGEWRMQARDFASTRYSPLNQITVDNVKQLRVAWTFSDGVAYGHEGAPLAVGSTM
jgi:glucose dehydrogenase